MAYEVIWEPPCGAYRKYSGHVADDELVQSISGLYGDPRFDDLRYIINDFLAVDHISVTEDAVTYIAAISGAAARSNPYIKVAILIGETQNDSLAKTYATSRWTVFPTRVFRNAEDARAWIGPDQASKL